MERAAEECGGQDFGVKVEQLNQITVIRLAGELDANTAVAADDALSKAVQDTNKHLLIDCQQLCYISSAGVGVLLSSLHACTEKDVQIIFYGLQPKIKDIFTVLGLTRLIIHTATQEEALRYTSTSS